MHILLTGVSGQIGGALVPRLQALGTVIAADRSSLDLTHPREIASTLDRLAPDLIVNPAAYTAVDKAEEERDLALAVNGESPGALAGWAAAHGVPLVHFSTDYVFSGAGGRPWREDDPPQPLSTYGASKLAGENAIRAAGGCSLILRTSWVYAARGRNFLRTIARLAREQKELRIISDQIGAPTSAALIADTVVDILAGGTDMRQRFTNAEGLVHFAAVGETSWYGFACAIVAGLRDRGVALAVQHIAPIRTEDYPTAARRPANSRLDLTRVKQVFDVNAISWEAALETELDQLAREIG